MSDGTVRILNLQLLMGAMLIALTATITGLNIGLPFWAALPVYSLTGSVALLILSAARYLRSKSSHYNI